MNTHTITGLLLISKLLNVLGVSSKKKSKTNEKLQIEITDLSLRPNKFIGAILECIKS